MGRACTHAGLSSTSASLKLAALGITSVEKAVECRSAGVRGPWGAFGVSSKKNGPVRFSMNLVARPASTSVE